MSEEKRPQQFKILAVTSLALDFTGLEESQKEAKTRYTWRQGGTNEETGELATSTKPDLILLEGDTPPHSFMSVLTVITRVKENAATRHIPIMVALNGLTTAAQMDAVMAAGAIDFICQPIQQEELLARIHTALFRRCDENSLKKRQQEMEQLTETLFLLNETIEEKNQELYQSVITDSLTQIYNRAFLLESMAREFSRNRRHNLPLSCIMIDIDHFKSFNDLYSHKVGDFILIQVTAAIQKIIRNEDIFGRLGGEEFLLILPGCSEEDSRIVAEKVRLYIEHHPFTYDDIILHPRISLGVADNAIGRPMKSDDLIHHADLALYEAKRSGRNRTILFSSILNKNIN